MEKQRSASERVGRVHSTSKRGGPYVEDWVELETINDLYN